MLEFLFRGFFEWIYGLIVDIWGFIAGGLLDIMGLDFAYIQSHIPIMDDMARVLMAAGWALLLGNLVFQALKSMAAGLGFEGEDPKLLFARTFVFAFLLLASPQDLCWLPDSFTPMTAMADMSPARAVLMPAMWLYTSTMMFWATTAANHFRLAL